MTFTEEQKKIINNISVRFRENKPSISESSIKTYTSLIRSLYVKKFGKEVNFNFDWFDNHEDVLDLVSQQVLSTQQTMLCALLALTPAVEIYKEYLHTIKNTIINQSNLQQKNKKQEDNWLTFDAVKNIYESLYSENKDLLKTKPPLQLNTQQWNHVLELLIMSLTCGYFIEPRRNLDWTELKLKNIDTEVDNWIDFDKKQFHFNRYKTDMKFGEQIIDIPKKLAKILKRFIRLAGDNEYLLTKNNGSKFESPDVTHTLNKIFKKNVSSSMLRHIYKTEKFGDSPTLIEMQKSAYNMAHSVIEGMKYIKR